MLSSVDVEMNVLNFSRINLCAGFFDLPSPIGNLRPHVQIDTILGEFRYQLSKDFKYLFESSRGGVGVFRYRMERRSQQQAAVADCCR